MKRPNNIFYYFFISLLITSCAAAPQMLIPTAVRMTAGRAVTSAVITGARGTSIAQTLGTVFTTAFAVNALGEAHIKNEVASNEFFNRVSLEYNKGSSPKILGDGQPFMEIHTRSRQLVDYKNNKYPIPDNIFTATSDGIVVRQGSLPNAREIHRIYKRDLVIKLAERDGWYQIRIARQPKPIEGWVKAEHLIALALLGDENDVLSDELLALEANTPLLQREPYSRPKPKIHDCAEMRTGDITFKNNTKLTVYISLYKEGMNIGYANYNKNLILAPDEEKSFYNLDIGVYKYEAKEHNRPVRAYSTFRTLGEVRVVMCEAVRQVIR